MSMQKTSMAGVEELITSMKTSIARVLELITSMQKTSKTAGILFRAPRLFIYVENLMKFQSVMMRATHD